MPNTIILEPLDRSPLTDHDTGGGHDQAIFTLDSDGRIVSWCQGVGAANRFSERSAIGKHYSTFFTEEDRATGKPLRLLEIARREGRVQDEGVRIRSDGSRFFGHISISRLDGANNQRFGYFTIIRDLTMTRVAEDIFGHRARLLNDARLLAGLGGWEWEISSDTITWTDEMFRIFGLAPSAMPKGFRDYLKFVHPADQDGVVASIEEARQRAGWFDHEKRILRPDGVERTLRSRGHAIVDESGEVLRMAGSCIDITELRSAHLQAFELAREQAARAAAEATARGLRFLVRTSELLVAPFDIEAALTDVAWLAVPEIADRFTLDLVGPGKVVRRVVTADRNPARLERCLDEHSGLERSLLRHAVETGEVQIRSEVTDEMLRGMARDEEQLRYLRELEVASLVAVPLSGRRGVIGAFGMIRTDPGRKFRENDIWVARELGRQIALAIENSRLQRVLEERNLMLEDQAAELEARTVELQRKTRHLETVMGELEAVNVALQLRTVEAEQANRAKAEFLAAMSHELRTPLNAIVGYTDILDLGVHGPVTRAQRESLARIKHNQRSLLALINDVLHFAKLEAGHVDLQITDVPVRAVIRDLDVVIEPQMRAMGLRYAYHLCAGSPRARGDRERIEQILLNLLTNAIKFTGRGGAIVLAVEAEPSIIRFSVSDTGRGVPPDRLDSIFDPFVQIERAPEELRERGVGLGLAISRDLAHAMGGSLSVESRLGEGSTFSLTLHRAE